MDKKTFALLGLLLAPGACKETVSESIPPVKPKVPLPTQSTSNDISFRMPDEPIKSSKYLELVPRYSGYDTLGLDKHLSTCVGSVPKQFQMTFERADSGYWVRWTEPDNPSEEERSGLIKTLYRIDQIFGEFFESQPIPLRMLTDRTAPHKDNDVGHLGFDTVPFVTEASPDQKTNCYEVNARAKTDHGGTLGQFKGTFKRPDGTANYFVFFRCD